MKPEDLKSYEERVAAVRSKWPHGPWTNEPDRVEWRHNGMPCLILRNPSGGNLCGYVGVAPGHPLHGLNYSDESPALAALLEKRKTEPIGEHPGMGILLACLSGTIEARPDVVLRAHGGLTYAEGCSGAICHVPAEGEPDNLWWFGFDCAHAGDWTPSQAMYGRDRPEWFWKMSSDSEYRDIAYVRAETESLADQLRVLEGRTT